MIDKRVDVSCAKRRRSSLRSREGRPCREEQEKGSSTTTPSRGSLSQEIDFGETAPPTDREAGDGGNGRVEVVLPERVGATVVESKRK